MLSCLGRVVTAGRLAGSRKTRDVVHRRLPPRGRSIAGAPHPSRTPDVVASSQPPDMNEASHEGKKTREGQRDGTDSDCTDRIAPLGVLEHSLEQIAGPFMLQVSTLPSTSTVPPVNTRLWGKDFAATACRSVVP